MNTAEERFELIERYLRNALGPEERAAFEAAVAADAVLAAEVQRHRVERQALELLVEHDLLGKMAAWDSEAPAWPEQAGEETRTLADWRAERDKASGAATPAAGDGPLTAAPGGKRAPGLWVTFKKIPLAARAAAAAVLLAVAGWLVLRDPAATTEPGSAPIARTTEPKTPTTTTKPSNNGRTTTPPAGRERTTPAPRPNNQPNTTTPSNPRTTPTPRRPVEEPAVTQRTPPTTPPTTRTTPTPAPPQTAATLSSSAYAGLAREFYREGDFNAVSSAASSGGSRTGLDKLQSEAFGKAAQRFQGRSYSEVEKLLQPIVRLNPNATNAKEMLAHALYRQGRYTDALRYFRQLAGGSGAVAERAQWAAVLTALHDMPRQQRVLDTMLNRIASRPGHAFYRQAQQLRQRIGNK